MVNHQFLAPNLSHPEFSCNINRSDEANADEGLTNE